MKLTEIWKTNDKPTVSFELFPARSEKAAVRLDKTIDILADCSLTSPRLPSARVVLLVKVLTSCSKNSNTKKGWKF